MEVTLAALADAANSTENGKLNLLGVFQTLYTSVVPVQHPSMTLVLALRASPGEKGTTQRIKIVLVDADGQHIGTPPEMVVTIPADIPGTNPELNFMVNLVNLTFPRFGAYSFDILVNDNSITRLPLSIVPVAPQTALQDNGEARQT